MTPEDTRRFGETISGFVAGMAPPLYIIATDRQRNIVVTSHDVDALAEQICSRVRPPGLASPLTVVAIAADGTVKWATVTIEVAGPTLQ